MGDGATDGELIPLNGSRRRRRWEYVGGAIAAVCMVGVSVSSSRLDGVRQDLSIDSNKVDAEMNEECVRKTTSTALLESMGVVAGWKSIADPLGGTLLTDRGLYKALRSLPDGYRYDFSASNRGIVDRYEELLAGVSSSDVVPPSEAGVWESTCSLTSAGSVGCTESCVQERFQFMDDGAFASCADPVEAAFVLAPELVKSCLVDEYDVEGGSLERFGTSTSCYECVSLCVGEFHTVEMTCDPSADVGSAAVADAARDATGAAEAPPSPRTTSAVDAHLESHSAPSGIVKHTYATSNTASAMASLNAMPVFGAFWDGMGEDDDEATACYVPRPEAFVAEYCAGSLCDCSEYAEASATHDYALPLAACECTCGSVGRVSLMQEGASRAYSAESFGIHTVDAAERPYGHGLSVEGLESVFAAEYADLGAWTRAMDMNTKFYVHDLDWSLEALAAGTPLHAVFWTDNLGRAFASLVVRLGDVAGGLLEVFSDTFDADALKRRAAGVSYPTATRYVFDDDGRSPDDVFGAVENDAFVVFPATVSHFTSDLDAMTAFYDEALDAFRIATTEEDGARTAFYDFRSHGVVGGVQIALVQRDVVAGQDAVEVFEKTILDAHADSTSEYEHFSQWLDYHYAIAGTDHAMDDLVDGARRAGAPLHFVAEAIGEERDAPGAAVDANLYVVTPNGVAVQIIQPDLGSWVPDQDLELVAGDLCG